MQLSPELQAQKKKLQTEMLFKDSDLKKCNRLKLDAEINIRELKKKLAQIQMDITVKENLMKKLMGESVMIQNELIKLKHKLNNLGRE